MKKETIKVPDFKVSRGGRKISREKEEKAYSGINIRCITKRKGAVSMDDNKGMGMMFGFLVGTLVGATIAFMIAPQTGEETREKIRVEALKMKEKAEKFVDEAREQAEKIVDEMKEKAAEMVEELKEDADVLMEKGKQAIVEKKAQVLEAISKHAKKGEQASAE